MTDSQDDCAATAAATARRGLWLALAAALALGTLLRVLTIVFPSDLLSPGGEVPGEEWRRASAAHDIASGPLLPIFDYQQTHFSGGTLAIVLAAVPFDRWLGTTPTALRLATLPFLWLALTFAVLLLQRAAGTRAAWIGGLLLAAASPGYQLLGATAWGTHVESNALSLGVAWACARHLERGTRASSVVLGLCSGLALWFSYGTALWIAVAAGIELCQRPRVRIWIAARSLGFVCGIAPWIYYGATHEWASLGLYGRSVGEHFGAPAESVSTLRALFTEHLPASLSYPALGGLSGNVIDVTLFLAYLGFTLTCAALAPRRDPVVRILLVLPLVFFAAYTFGDFRVQIADAWIHGYRYLALMWPCLWLATALALDALVRRGAWTRVLAWLAAATLIGTPVAGACIQLRPDRFEANRVARPDSVVSMARFVVRRRGTDLAALERVVERVQQRTSADEFFRALGANYRYLLSADGSVKPEDRARQPGYERARAFLEARVESRFQAYFASKSSLK